MPFYIAPITYQHIKHEIKSLSFSCGTEHVEYYVTYY